MTGTAPLTRDAKRLYEGWLRRQAKDGRGFLITAVAAGLASGVTLIAQCWLLAKIVDTLVVEHRRLPAVSTALLLLLVTVLIRFIASTMSDQAAFEAGAAMKEAVRARVLAHVVALGPSWTRLQQAGEVAGTLLDATESVGRYCSGYLPQAVVAALLPLAILAFVIPTDWVSGLIMVISAPLIPVFMVLIGKGTEALNQAQWRRLARLGGRLFDAIEGLTTLKLFGASRAEAQTIATLCDEYRLATMAVLRVAFLSSLALEFIATISIAMVAVYIGFRLYYGEMRLLPGLAVLLIAPEFYRVLRAMGTQYHARMEAIAATEAIVAILDVGAPPTVNGGAALPDRVQQLRIEGVSFRRGATVILRDLDLVLERGRCIAITGPSGAGKTTLAEMLLGFTSPESGRIMIDGQDLEAVCPATWRSRVAWLPQRPTLFHGTIRENIRLSRPDADDEAIRHAVALAGAEGVIDRVARGLDTVVGDRGQGLSGGEIQRIALARAFLGDADLLVLDEPVAALDAANAAHVARSIRALSAERAILVIAHDAFTTREADEVLALKDGRLTPTVRRRQSAPLSPTNTLRVLATGCAT